VSAADEGRLGNTFYSTYRLIDNNIWDGRCFSARPIIARMK
jgi:hypothetical protein